MKNAGEITIFIVDDDKLFTGFLKNEILKNFGEEEITISVFEAGEQCELFIEEQPDIAFVDFHMNSKYKDAMNGIKIMDLLKTKSPATEIIMFTCEDNVALAKKAFKHGACDYIIKNSYMCERLNLSLRQCINVLELRRELQQEKSRGLFALIVMALLLGIVTTIQIFAPRLL